MRERRLVKVNITFDLLFEWLTQGNEIKGVIETTKGLPEDAVFIASQFDDRCMQASLIFEHESFSPVPVGSEIPYFDILFTQYVLEKKEVQHA